MNHLLEFPEKSSYITQIQPVLDFIVYLFKYIKILKWRKVSSIYLTKNIQGVFPETVISPNTVF